MGESSLLMSTVVCDWETKGNVVRLYCCDEDVYDEVWGDDWDDYPYEHNAGQVNDKYVSYIVDLAFNYDIMVMEAEKDYYYHGNSPYCKKDFKDKLAPIFVLGYEEDWWDNSYHTAIGAENSNRILKIYMGQNLYTLPIWGKNVCLILNTERVTH